MRGDGCRGEGFGKSYGFAWPVEGILSEFIGTERGSPGQGGREVA